MCNYQTQSREISAVQMKELKQRIQLFWCWFYHFTNRFEKRQLSKLEVSLVNFCNLPFKKSIKENLTSFYIRNELH